VDKGHGRFERRTLRTTPAPASSRLWPGLAQGFEVQRERTVQGKKSVEVVYGVTSLTETEADARRLSVLVREHWHIENRLHYVRDVTLGEDACRVRKGSAPQVLAALRNACVHLLSGVAAESRQAATERLAARPNEALQLVGRPPLE
jgi:predicted transposase YbfD/YdcC